MCKSEQFSGVEFHRLCLKESLMKESTKNGIKGKVEEVKGKAKAIAGRATKESGS
jgi:hypothetical protein